MILKNVSYTLIFSFLLTGSGCFITQNYSDTPDKIFSGKSDIDLKGNYILDRISFYNKRIIQLNNYEINFTERQKEKWVVSIN